MGGDVEEIRADLETVDGVALTVANEAEAAARSAVADSLSDLAWSSSVMPLVLRGHSPLTRTESDSGYTRHVKAGVGANGQSRRDFEGMRRVLRLPRCHPGPRVRAILRTVTPMRRVGHQALNSTRNKKRVAPLGGWKNRARDGKEKKSGGGGGKERGGGGKGREMKPREQWKVI